MPFSNDLKFTASEQTNPRGDFAEKISSDNDYKYLGGNVHKFDQAYNAYDKAIKTDATLSDKPVNEVLTSLGIEKSTYVKSNVAFDDSLKEIK